MAATVATTAMLNANCLGTNSPKTSPSSKPSAKSISLLSLQNLPKNLLLAASKSSPEKNPDLSTSSLTGTAIAGVIFSNLASCSGSALAAQQIAKIAEGDNRGLALLLPLIPAILWVLYNILQPALNQINQMRNTKKGIIMGLGLGGGGGLAATGFLSTPNASAAAATEIAAIAEAAGDNRGQLLLFVVAPAILWVLYNILQPALNQLNRMRSD